MDTFEVFWKLAEIEASFSIGSIGNMHVYIHFLTLLAEIFGQLFGLTLNDYTQFYCFKGWPKFLLALWSNHLSYAHIRLFCQCVPKKSKHMVVFTRQAQAGRDFGRVLQTLK